MTRAYCQIEVPTAEDLAKAAQAALNFAGVRIVGITPFADAGATNCSLGYILCIVARDAELAVAAATHIDAAINAESLQSELPL